MLSFSNLIIFEEVNTAEIEIQKNLELSNQDKKDIDKLIHEFDQAENKHDKEYHNLFNSKLSSNPIDQNLQDWKNRNIDLYVLRKLGKIIGFCSIIPNYRVFKDSVYVQYLCISKNERSSGYGRYFLNYVIEDIKKNYPNKHVIINVFDRNLVAKKLYLSAGFRPGTMTLVKF